MLAWNTDDWQIDLTDALTMNRHWTGNGSVADYIPELRWGDPNQLGIVVTSNYGSIKAGDCGMEFTLQSIVKILTLMLALEDQGEEKVFSHVGSEPTGDPFNSIIKLETTSPRKPLNPMINAGAIAVCSLLSGQGVEGKMSRITSFISTIINREVGYSHAVHTSEKETGDRNRALAYFMKDVGVLIGDVDEVLDLYFRCCSIELTCSELARIGYFLAMKGRLEDGCQLVSKATVRLVTTFMVTCGMYNASGEFAIHVGIPAKSGVSGGILAVVPDTLGIGIYGPSLDDKGNSIGGVKLLQDLSKRWDLSIF